MAKAQNLKRSLLNSWRLSKTFLFALGPTGVSRLELVAQGFGLSHVIAPGGLASFVKLNDML